MKRFKNEKLSYSLDNINLFQFNSKYLRKSVNKFVLVLEAATRGVL